MVPWGHLTLTVHTWQESAVLLIPPQFVFRDLLDQLSVSISQGFRLKFRIVPGPLASHTQIHA